MDEQGTHSEFTNTGERIDRKQFGGAPANAFFIPTAIILAILHVVIISLIFSINTESSKLSQTMQESSTYISDATSLLGGSSLLSETSSNYVLMPVTSSGEPNVRPLIAYSEELVQADHRGDQVKARFDTYQVNEQVHQDISNAALSANALIDTQLRAIALVSSVNPLPDIPALAGLELPALSPEDAALSNDAKVQLAQTLILDSDYASNKQAVSKNVNEAVGIIRGTSGAVAASASRTIEILRIALWVVTTTIIVFLCLVFVALYRLFISPVGKFSKLIIADKPLGTRRGLREMRLLAGSYNSLRERRETLEGILREAAETDSLTGLPNRYCLRRNLAEAEGKGYSLSVFIFDVDRLKITNDTFGHAAGDDLIKRAAQCISTCFASTDNGMCYRMGGDEFVATIRNISEDEIDEAVTEFREMMKRLDVSISWGQAYAPEIGDTTFKALMDEADHKLYAMKKEVHQRDALEAARNATRSA